MCCPVFARARQLHGPRAYPSGMTIKDPFPEVSHRRFPRGAYPRQTLRRPRAFFPRGPLEPKCAEAKCTSLERFHASGRGIDIDEIAERKLGAITLVAGDPLVIVNEVTGPIEDEAAVVILDAFRMV